MYFTTSQRLRCVCGSSAAEGCAGSFTLGMDGHFTGELDSDGLASGPLLAVSAPLALPLRLNTHAHTRIGSSHIGF